MVEECLELKCDVLSKIDFTLEKYSTFLYLVQNEDKHCKNKL